MRRYALLDRDGTIIVDRDYLCDPNGVELLPRAAQGLRAIQAMGMGLLIITNQSGVGRGRFGIDRLQEIHEGLKSILLDEGIFLDGIYICLHHPDDECACRKPRTGLVERAQADLGFCSEECVVIGDKPCDWELGRRLGAFAIGICGSDGDSDELPEASARDLVEAADLIRKHFDRIDRAAARRGVGD